MNTRQMNPTSMAARIAVATIGLCLAGTALAAVDLTDGHRARLLVEVMEAVVGEIGAGRTAIRISPVTPANGVADPVPAPLFREFVAAIKFPLAVIEL